MAQTFRPNNRERAKCQAQFTPRYRELDALERYVTCEQYEGRPSYFDDADAPIRDRAPCVNYPVVGRAIRGDVDFVLGEGRWPTITSHSSEDDSDLDDEYGLDEDDSETLDGFLGKVEKQARLKSVARELLTEALGCRTAVAIGMVRAGKLRVQTVKAKWCTRVADPEDSNKTLSLEIRYPYLERYYDASRKCWTERCKLYRRVVDDKVDAVWGADCPDLPDQKPKWVADKSATREHGLGFCPVVWYRHQPKVESANDDDGRAIHEGLFGNIDSLNFALSQRHRAAFYCGDPQIVETGVELDHNQAPAGRRGMVSAVGKNGGLETWEAGKDPALGYPRGARSGNVKRRGVGVTWRYDSKDAKVSLLTLSGDALKPIQEDASDLLQGLAEAMSVVFINLGGAKYAAEFTGKALQVLYKPQLAACDQIREDFGENCLLPLVDMLLRIAYTVDNQRPGSLYLAGIGKVRGILAGFMREVQVDGSDQPANDWMPPHLDLVWGRYFPPDPTEESAIIAGAVAAKKDGVVDTKKAVERVAKIFNIENVDEYVETLKEEKIEAFNDEMSLTHAMNKMIGGDDGGDGRGDESRSSGDAAVGASKPAKAGSGASSPTSLASKSKPSRGRGRSGNPSRSA